MRDEGAIYVAGHPLLNKRCTTLTGCIRLRNDLYRFEWGVKLYSLTHSLASSVVCFLCCYISSIILLLMFEIKKKQQEFFSSNFWTSWERSDTGKCGILVL